MRAVAKAVPGALLAATKYSGVLRLLMFSSYFALGLLKAGLWIRTGFNVDPDPDPGL